MNHFARTSSLVIATTLVLTAAPPRVWVVGSLVRVGQTDVAGSQTQITLYAARGEYESFQIGIQAPSGGLNSVNVTASDLTGPAGRTILASNLTLYRENYVTVAAGQTSPMSADGGPCTNCPLGPGSYPDGLIPFADPDTGLPLSGAASLRAVPFALPAGQNQPIWVDVFVPPTATAGPYAATFTVTSDQGQAQVSLLLNVWKFSLPLKPSLKSAFLTWDDAHKTATDKELVRHRLMPDMTVDPAEASDLQSNGGLSATGIPFYSGTSFGQCAPTSPPPSVAEVQGASQPYQRLNLLVYDYSFDEIDLCTNLYPTVIQWAQSLHLAGVSQLITMEPVPALYDDGLGTGRSAVDIWTMLPDMYDDAQAQNPPRVTTVLAKGDQAWSYQTLVQDAYSPKWLIDFPPVGLRVQAGFISQSLNLTGLLYWKVDGWLSGTGAASWSNVDYRESGSHYPGEAIFVYPGDAVGMNGKVAPSMRLKWLRDGVEDYEYVQILKGLGGGIWALQVAASVGADWRNWTRDPVALEAARFSLGQAIDQLLPSVPVIAMPSALLFSYETAGSLPSGQTVLIHSAAQAVTLGTPVFTTQSCGQGWLLQPILSQNTTDASMVVQVAPNGLPAGTCTGSIAIPYGSNQTVDVSVTLIIKASGTPNPRPLAVTNNASDRSGAIAPGELIAIKGTLLGPTTPVAFSVNTQGGVDAALAGVLVLFDGIPGTMIYASAVQLNVTVPWGIAGRLATNVVVEYNSVQSAPVRVRVSDAAPGIYTADSTGLHQAAALNQNNTINGATTGTAPDGQGQVIVLYATGCGVTSPPGVTGSVSPSNQLLRVQGPVSVTVSGQNAPVLFIGAAPTYVNGVCQINAQLPSGLTGNSLPVVLTVHGVSSPAGPTIAVQ